MTFLLMQTLTILSTQMKDWNVYKKECAITIQSIVCQQHGVKTIIGIKEYRITSWFIPFNNRHNNKNHGNNCIIFIVGVTLIKVSIGMLFKVCVWWTVWKQIWNSGK